MSDHLWIFLANSRDTSRSVMSYSATTIPTTGAPMLMGAWRCRKEVKTSRKSTLLWLCMHVYGGPSVILSVMMEMVVMMMMMINPRV